MDRLFMLVCWTTSLLLVVILIVLLGSIVIPGLNHLDWDFLTSPTSRDAAKAGMSPAIWGSIWTCLICAFLALPLGVGTAVVLEEYKPRGVLMRRLHGFVQLNIANLAGVPSIVYGIIGLTVFANMFGLFGPALTSDTQFGITWYDEYVDESGQYLRVEAGGRHSPLSMPTEEMVAVTDEGEAIAIDVVMAETSTGAPGELLVDVQPQRVSEKAWYFIQLPFGRGVLAGGLTLMLVVLPVVIISSQEAIRAVPDSLREGALGLGSTRWQMVWRMTFPASIPGIMTGAILAVSRAIGEAAPLLILAGIVYITFTPRHLMDDFTAMPLQIYNWASLPQKEFHEVAATGIIVLLAVLLSFNTVAVFVRQRFQKSSP